MNLCTNNTNSILISDLIYHNLIKESDVKDGQCDGEGVFIYDVLGNLTDIDFDFLNKIKCKKLLIDTSSNDGIGKAVYKSLNKKLKRDFKVISKSLDFKELNYLYYDQQMFRMKDFVDILDSYDDLQKDFNRNYLLPQKKGMFFAGHPRFHKLKILNFLHLNNLLDSLYWTSSKIDYDLPKGITWVHDVQDRDDEYLSFDVIKLLPKKLDYKYETSNHHLVSIGITINWGFYLNSCFDIVGETCFYDDNFIHHVSEKTLKPILCGMPFIMLNYPQTIKKLEDNFGFNFSYDIWTHDYDDITNSEERLNSIEKQLKKILTYSREDLKEFSYQYKLQTKQNRDILINEFWKGSLKRIVEYINE